MKIFVLLFLFQGAAHAHDHGGGNAAIGPGKGVEVFDDDGFVLAEAAIRRIGIKTEKIEASPNCDLKKAEVVSALSEKKIYIKRGKSFKGAPVTCSSVKVGDEVVVKGAEFLRVIEMDLGADEEDEHGEEGEDSHGHGSEKHGEKESSGEHHD